VCFWLLCACTLVEAQGSYSDTQNPVHGIFEQYLGTDPSHRGVQGTLSFLELDGDLSPSFKLVGSVAFTPDWDWLEEEYAQLNWKSNLFKFGRFRSPFGFNNWSEMYYTPFIGLPIIRGYGTEIVPNRSINRQDGGVEAEGGGGALQYQLAVVDSAMSDWEVTPRQMDTAIGRLQVSGGQFMIGLDGFAKESNHRSGPGEQMAGIDFRWTAPRVQVRGEFVKGIGNQGTSGYYVDLFYRPPGLARTQLGARVQGIDAYNKPSADSTSFKYYQTAPNEYGSEAIPSHSAGTLYTLAVRQFLTSNFTLDVNYGMGANIPQTNGLSGWSVQLQSTFRF